MATLVLASAGAAAGSALMPAGVSIMGATLSGAVIGRAVGSMAGRYIDQALFGASGQNRIVENTGSRLSDLQVTSSSEGAPIPRIFGRVRLGGQIIWATRFEEQAVRTQSSTSGSAGGGKGLGGGTSGGTTTTSYVYYANFAVALCEGEITRIGSVWSDGNEINLDDYTYRLYRGTQTQQPDSLIEAREGADNAPAYRGLSYIVFERMPLAAFGNRIPQLNFEVFKALDDVEQQITGVTLIPASGEFAYEVEQVARDDGRGTTAPENSHHQLGGADWSASIDQLQDVMPNCKSVSLFVSWFGTDLRAEHCRVVPGVESRDKLTTPYDWQVAGQLREQAHLVSSINDRPAYGGTPTDHSVINALRDLRTRGFKVTFNPFLMMDIAADNRLPDPYGGSSQPAFPWRGRISCDPAPGHAGSPDKSPAAAGQLAAFIGTCSISDFDISSGQVVYSGPVEWSWRRMVLHYAHLCKLAGGVDVFLLGSELRGLTQVRDGADSYPFVTALVQLAADVKAVLGADTGVSYAADWSEYFGHQPADGSHDVYFNLDPLWASADVDAVAIDCYWPLADWRDDEAHLDAAAGWRSIYDLDYLKSNLTGGEGYDWYYASSQDRDNQLRTPITDGGGKPWLFRYKDLFNWWSHHHHNRPGGVEADEATGWMPEAKPFWLMEVGCPALDKGANEPNLFYDPKSSESRMPHYSSGTRDDTIQRRYLQAFFESFDPAHEDFRETTNPVSQVYGGRMVDPQMIHAYTWDARPYPAFPYNSEVWSDGDNWFYGHWLNGRMAGGPLRAVVQGILDGYGFEHYELDAIDGMMDGYILDSVMSARDALQPLEMAFFLDSFESGGRIRFAHKGQGGSLLSLSRDALVEADKAEELYTLTRAQETDLPRSAKITYIDGLVDYRQAVVEARRHVGASNRVSTAQLPMVLGQQQAQTIADSWLHDVWSGRETASFSLPPSMLALEPGDMLRLELDNHALDLRLTSVETALARKIEALSLQPHIYRAAEAPLRLSMPTVGKLFGAPVAVFLDLPLLRSDQSPSAGYVAAFQSPWPGGVSFYNAAGDSGYQFAARCNMPALVGELTAPLAFGPHSRWDHGNSLEVRLYDGELYGQQRLEVLAGGNLAALEHADGLWEVIQFQKAELIASGHYRLSGLLRGLAGTEAHMSLQLAAGARFVMLDEAVEPLGLSSDEVGLAYNWKVGPSPYNIGHSSYRTYSRAFAGLGYKPLAPVHVRAGRDQSGDISIGWVRRARTGADSWQALEVPLVEDREAYEVDIFKDGAPVRTLSAAATSLLYTAADQHADFGALPEEISIAVVQLSTSFGRGHVARRTITL